MVMILTIATSMLLIILMVIYHLNGFILMILTITTSMVLIIIYNPNNINHYKINGLNHLNDINHYQINGPNHRLPS
jgi:hypothetical protein